jgi:hypothetical protein
MSIRKYINNIQDHIEDILKAHYIADAVNSLKPEVSPVTITAPPHAGLADLINLAQKHGIGTSENQKAKLTLIPVDSNTNTPLAGSTKILLMPVEKKYRKMLKNLSQSQAQRAWSYYEKFDKNLDVFDIILNEGQSTRKTLLALIHKLYLLQRLREMRQRPVPAGTDGISCFIIWGHGLEHKNEILKMIEKHFQIVTVQEKKIPDIAKFIRDIYIEEILKIGYHIVKKNSHLLKHRKEATLILAKNKKNPQDFTCYGHGPNQRVCSSMEEHLKQVIRDTYNPRKAAGIRSEQHVIHGTQSSLQIENILRAFELKPLRHWLENKQNV